MIALAAAASMISAKESPATHRARFEDKRLNAVVRELVDGYQPGRERRGDRGEAFVRMEERDARQIDTNALLQRMLTDRGLAQRILFYPGDGRRTNPFIIQRLEGTENSEIRIRPERERPDPRRNDDQERDRETERASIGRLVTLMPRNPSGDRIVIAPLGPTTTASSLGQFGAGSVTGFQRGMARMEAGSDVAARWTTPTDTLSSRRTPGLGGLSDMAVRRLESLRGDSILSAERDLSRFQSPAMGSMRRGLSDMRRTDYSGQNFGRGFSSAPSGSLGRFSNGLR